MVLIIAQASLLDLSATIKRPPYIECLHGNSDVFYRIFVNWASFWRSAEASRVRDGLSLPYGCLCNLGAPVCRCLGAPVCRGFCRQEEPLLFGSFQKSGARFSLQRHPPKGPRVYRNNHLGFVFGRLVSEKLP